jgi:hypothetical protein
MGAILRGDWVLGEQISKFFKIRLVLKLSRGFWLLNAQGIEAVSF